MKTKVTIEADELKNESQMWLCKSTYNLKKITFCLGRPPKAAIPLEVLIIF